MFCSIFKDSEEVIFDTFKLSYFPVMSSIFYLIPADIMLIVDDLCRIFTGPFSQFNVSCPCWELVFSSHLFLFLLGIC